MLFTVAIVSGLGVGALLCIASLWFYKRSSDDRRRFFARSFISLILVTAALLLLLLPVLYSYEAAQKPSRFLLERPAELKFIEESKIPHRVEKQYGVEVALVADVPRDMREGDTRIIKVNAAITKIINYDVQYDPDGVEHRVQTSEVPEPLNKERDQVNPDELPRRQNARDVAETILANGCIAISLNLGDAKKSPDTAQPLDQERSCQWSVSIDKAGDHQGFIQAVKLKPDVSLGRANLVLSTASLISSKLPLTVHVGTKAITFREIFSYGASFLGSAATLPGILAFYDAHREKLRKRKEEEEKKRKEEEERKRKEEESRRIIIE